VHLSHGIVSSTRFRCSGRLHHIQTRKATITTTAPISPISVLCCRCTNVRSSAISRSRRCSSVSGGMELSILSTRRAHICDILPPDPTPPNQRCRPMRAVAASAALYSIIPATPRLGPSPSATAPPNPDMRRRHRAGRSSPPARGSHRPCPSGPGAPLPGYSASDRPRQGKSDASPPRARRSRP
jgi:hypothetical protein